jgi:PAS domain S-box-containing protein
VTKTVSLPLPSYATFILLLYFISGTITLYFTVLGWRHRNVRLSLPFTLVMACLTVWFYAYILEITSPDLETALFFNNIEVPCILTIPVGFLLIVLSFTGRERYITARTLPLFFLVPLVLIIAEMTNPFHHLYYTGFSVAGFEWLNLWIYFHGPFFYIAVIYSYVLSFFAVFLILSHISETGRCYQRPLVFLLLASLAPFLANLMYVCKVPPSPYLDLTPLSFMVTTLLLTAGLFRYLFTRVPVAYARIIATMRDAIIITSSPFRITDLNPAAERVLCVSLRDAVGREVGVLLPGLPESLTRTGIPEDGIRAEYQLAGAGGIRYFDVMALPLGPGSAAQEGRLFVLRDITERKEVELALADANRKIRLLSSITRHDIQNQLAGLSGYLELSRDSLDNPSDMSRYLAKMQMVAKAIDSQIAFTRDYENLGGGPPIWQDVRTCIRESMEGLAFGGIQVRIDPIDLEVLADPLLGKVFYNLFDNALRYGGSGMTTILVSSFAEGTCQVIVVSDDGQGVAEKEKERIFFKGFGKNTGLGLFLTREILSLTNITIVETGGTGRGARFEIRVPPDRFRLTSR